MSLWIRNEGKSETASAFPAALSLAASRGRKEIVAALLGAGAEPYGAAAAAAFGGYWEIAGVLVERFPDEVDRWMYAGGEPRCGVGALDYGLSPVEGFAAGGFELPAAFEGVAEGDWREEQLDLFLRETTPELETILERLCQLKGVREIVEWIFEEGTCVCPKGLAIVMEAADEDEVIEFVEGWRARSAWGGLKKDENLMFLHALAVRERRDAGAVAAFRALGIDMRAVLRRVLDEVTSEGLGGELMEDLVVLFGDDWSGVEACGVWVEGSPKIWRRLIELRCGVARDAWGVKPAREWLASKLSSGGEVKFVNLLTSLGAASAGCFVGHRFPIEVLWEAPGAGIWLVDHGATVKSTWLAKDERGGEVRKQARPAQIERAIAEARRKMAEIG
jgi:hypothetical protein